MKSGTSNTVDLYTAKEVSEVKKQLLLEQKGKCAITGMEFEPKDFHTDHCHDDLQYVRGALYKQSNMTLGKLENLWTRYLAFWYNGTLQDFLRQSANYLDSPVDQRWRHPGWLKKLKTRFNKLSASQMDSTLEQLGSPKGRNATERKKLFAKAIMNRDLGYNTISGILDNISKKE